MKWHVDYTPPPFPFGLSHRHRLLFMGSCFAEHIGALFREHAFSAEINPAGILFNPLSLARSFSEDAGSPETYLRNGDLWHSYDFHSSVSAETDTALSEKIKTIREALAGLLSRCDALFVSFGTAHVFRRNDNLQVVGNCHRQPAPTFTKERCSIGQIVECWEPLLQSWNTLYPDLKIIFTVSPVKYLREGLIENARSKAVLLLATEKLCNSMPNACYFPSYELVAEDLRDHRFYKEDLAHPNDLAVAYVWERLSNCLFSEKTRTVNQQVAQLRKALRHVPRTRPERDPALQHYIEQQTRLIQSLEPAVSLESLLAT